MEEIGVAESRPERRSQVHPALKRVVEPQIAGALVVDDREAVIARVLGVHDPEAVALKRARRRLVAKHVDGGPVLGRGTRESAAGLGRERDDGYGGTDGRDRTRERDERHPLGQADCGHGSEQGRSRESQQLVRAEARNQPERGQERAGDASGRRDREEPPRRTTRAANRARTKPDRDRGDACEDDAHRPEQENGRGKRVQPRTGVPAQHRFEHRLVDDGNREHEQRSYEEHTDEQASRWYPVGKRSPGPVAHRKAREHDPDERSPDEERVAEVRGNDAARRDLDPEQDCATGEDRDPDRERAHECTRLWDVRAPLDRTDTARMLRGRLQGHGARV